MHTEQKRLGPAPWRDDLRVVRVGCAFRPARRRALQRPAFASRRLREFGSSIPPSVPSAISAVLPAGFWRHAVRFAAFALLLLAIASLRAADAAAEELVGKLRAAQQTTGVLLRARLVVADTAGERRNVMQLRVQGRRDGDLAHWRYQALWPAARRGQALCLEKSDTGAITGFWFEPPAKVTPLAPEMIAGPFFGSDLCIDELAEDFWQWPGPVVSGADTLGGEKCAIVDFRPPAGRGAAVAFVRAWISPAKTIPVRIEKHAADGHIAKSFVFQKPVQRDGIWTPTVMVVQIPGGTSETTLEISRGERDVAIPVTEFSSEAVQRFAQALEQEAVDAANQGSHSVHK